MAANDQIAPQIVCDVTVTSHAVQTRLVIWPSAEGIRFSVNGIEVPREDFRAVMELHALVGRARLMPQ